MINQEAVYIIKKPGQQPGDIYLAMDVQLGSGRLGYYDTIHAHNIDGELKEETNDGFIFNAKRPGAEEEWAFSLLTLDYFESKVRFKVDGAKEIPKLQSTEDLHEWYRRKFINP